MMYTRFLPLLAAVSLALSLATLSARSAEKKSDEEFEVVSLACVEEGSGGFRWKDDEAELKKFGTSRHLVKLISETKRTVVSGTRERTLLCISGGEGMTICRQGYETWAFNDDKSFTLSYIHGGVVGGSANIFLSYGTCQVP